ncbi:MAG: glycine cleavage system aminomethyltransferase GcvT [Gammaproteobacteria bacterium]|nr:glycine cleavage system aminomethyltransferase GcvT [Gammaproteobacteria bacterium]
MTEASPRRTPLHAEHLAAGGKMVDFAGWEMPLHYGSQLAEHHAVRNTSGMFDVSHMTVIDFAGDAALSLLRRVMANDVAKLEAPGQALYGVLTNADGGVIDDLIVYRRDDGYRAVVNAATRGKVLGWLQQQNEEGAHISERDLAMIAVQGPQAIACFEAAAGWQSVADIAPFNFRETGGWMVARTGYTGEDGVEVILPGDAAAGLWRALAGTGVAPAGLGARDTLRLEAGLNLYGQDMDEDTSPLVANLAWTIAWQPESRDFIGRAALERQRAGKPADKLTGLVLETRGVLRHGQRVVTGAGDGTVTSGIFSPTLGYSIALARLPRAAKGECQVDLRGKLKPARIVKPPFIRKGKKVFK